MSSSRISRRVTEHLGKFLSPYALPTQPLAYECIGHVKDFYPTFQGFFPWSLKAQLMLSLWLGCVEPTGSEMMRSNAATTSHVYANV